MRHKGSPEAKSCPIAVCLLAFFASASIVQAQDVGSRATVDLPDDKSGYQVHVMYVLPSDGSDRRLDVDSQLDRSVASFQSWFAAQSGGREVRMDTVQGRLDVTFFRTRTSNQQLLERGVFLRCLGSRDRGCRVPTSREDVCGLL